MDVLFTITSDDLRKLAHRCARKRALSPEETKAFEIYCIERVPPALQQGLQDELEYFLDQFAGRK